MHESTTHATDLAVHAQSEEPVHAQSEAHRGTAHTADTVHRERTNALVGEIAHDFNNLLLVILGNARLLESEIPAGTNAAASLAAVVEAAEFAARLAGQLLTCAGRQPPALGAVDLSVTASRLTRILHELRPHTVHIRLALGEGLPKIVGDVTQVQQVLMNLLVNAIEASGSELAEIELATGVCELDAEGARGLLSAAPLAPGRYVTLAVRDHGCGIERALVERIFEPFFSTKPDGRGLGLPACLGIVRNHGGGLRVEAAPGGGTIVTAFFPPGPNDERRLRPVRRTPTADAPHVLVVDDEPRIRTIARRVLQREGYVVTEAGGGREALEILRSEDVHVDLVLLDLTMPDLDGERTYVALRGLHPEMPVLFSSGYDATRLTQDTLRAASVGFLQKPYHPAELVARVAELVEGARAVAGDG